MSNTILFKGWKILWQTTNYIVALKQILTSGFFCVCLFFLKSQQYVFSDVKEEKKGSLIVANHFRSMWKLKQRGNMNFWLKQRRPKILFLVQKSSDQQLWNDYICYLPNCCKPDDGATKDKSYFHISICVMFHQSEKNCNYFTLFLENFKERSHELIK